MLNVYVFRVPSEIGRLMNRLRWAKAESYVRKSNTYSLPLGQYDNAVKKYWEKLTDHATPSDVMFSHKEAQIDDKNKFHQENFVPHPYGGAVVVLDTESGQAAVSVCSLYDKFDLDKGVAVALERLDNLSPESNNELLKRYVPQWNHPAWRV